MNLIPLDVEPPREVPEDERILRDRKEKQLKVKEVVSDKYILSLFVGNERTEGKRRKRKAKNEE